MSESTPDVSGEYLYTIGDIGVTRTTVVTPNGTMPLSGSKWLVTDNTRVETAIPTYAIVLAIVFAAVCLIGLLFLLIKEQRISGYVEVSVRGPQFYHVTQIPARDLVEVQQVRAYVHNIQAFAAQAPGQPESNGPVA